MASVAFEQLDKIYPGGTRAITEFTLRIEDGELVVLVGPSGCGKSTLLRLLAGLETPTSGSIRIGDRVVNDWAPRERNIAMVFQDYALYPFMSVRGNLEFPLKMRKLATDELRRRVNWAAQLLDITQLLDRLPKQLSGGQRQRVAMGRALVREPAVFLLDEPLSNLDAKLRAQVRAEIAELQQRTGTTMIYVTHDQVEAMTLGHRVALLDKGVLQQVAAPRQLYDRPANVFVAGFIGNPPMNLFATRLATDAHGVGAISLGGQRVSLPLPPRGRDGTDLIVGIRAEAFRLASGDRGTITAVVEQVEYLGHETLAYVRSASVDRFDAVRFVVRLEGMRDLVKGATIALDVDLQQVHLFDSTGVALTDQGRG